MGRTSVSEGGGPIRVEVLQSEAGVGTSVRLETGRTWLLIDCGDGTANALARERLDVERLAGIVFTHGHPDHVAGLYGLLSRLRLLRRRSTLPVRVPRKCREPGLILGAWRRRYPKSEGYAVGVRAFDPNRTFGLGCYSLRPFRVRHRGSLGPGRVGLLPAVGFEVRVGGRRLVLSGDTGPCAALERVVPGADLALIEATYPRAASHRPDSHLSVAQARRIGRRAREYRLYHLSPASRQKLRSGEEATRVVLSASGPRGG